MLFQQLLLHLIAHTTALHTSTMLCVSHAVPSPSGLSKLARVGPFEASMPDSDLQPLRGFLPLPWGVSMLVKGQGCLESCQQLLSRSKDTPWGAWVKKTVHRKVDGPASGGHTRQQDEHQPATHDTRSGPQCHTAMETCAGHWKTLQCPP